MYWKRSNSNGNGKRRDKVALRTTCIQNVKFKIIKMKTGCQYTYIYVGYFYYTKDLHWAACGPRLDIAALVCSEFLRSELKRCEEPDAVLK